jgi:hypothetical protein
MKSGYYNTWTEEINDVSETDEDTTTTDAATTEDSVSEMSPGTGLNIEFGISTGGLDFMSSSGYPQIEFGYDDASDNEEDSGEDEDEISTNPDLQGPNGGGNQRQNLVSEIQTATLFVGDKHVSLAGFHQLKEHLLLQEPLPAYRLDTDTLRFSNVRGRVHAFSARSKQFCTSLWNIVRNKHCGM